MICKRCNNYLRYDKHIRGHCKHCMAVLLKKWRELNAENRSN